MIAAERTVLVLLAAGRSTRFGGSKLDAALEGMPIGLHAARALAEVPFLARVAVVADAAVDYAAEGFSVIRNEDPVRDMASSLRLGVHLALTGPCRPGEEGDAPDAVSAILVALADMPRVTAAHIYRLLAAADGPNAIVASSDGRAAKPPALFGRSHFAALLAITGDHGARDLIRTGVRVETTAEDLADIDTIEDLATISPSPRA